MNNQETISRPTFKQALSVAKNNIRTAAGFAKSILHGRRIEEHRLTFVDDGMGEWYIDLPNWPGSRAQLAMVAGADRFLTHMAEGRPRLTVDVRVSDEETDLPGYVLLRQTRQDYGADYAYSREQAVLQGYPDFMDGSAPATAWLCPVTLFVLGRYPKYIYVKRHDD